MISFQLEPGESLGPFSLGDTLWHVLDFLRTNKTVYPKFEVSWDPDNASRSSVTIHISDITLLFISPSQRLSLIRVSLSSPSSSQSSTSTSSSSSSLTLTYQSEIIASPNSPLTRAKVARALGPTYASSSGSAKLSYPGIGFDFASSSKEREDVVETVTVTPREELESTSCVELDGLEIEINVTTEQDLLLGLGAPLRKYYKTDDRLARMWGSGMDDTGGCFWNYFELGLDFFIVGGLVQKIIAHSNIQYARCPWVIPAPSGVLDLTSPLSAFQTQLIGSGYEDSGGKAADSTNESRGSPDAMLLDRAVDGGFDGVIGVSPSKLIGFDGLIIEQDQKSGGITSVIVYNHAT